ncbi:thioesterase II family protein [Streptomyces antimicrobicus]|uniref:Thioesterase n=1 Tax=Streptomyces antimicrobicus TaxID=2883108 RepID=A0ABS8B1U4_9ACTN|nr:thioesterase domain-containing protein [Streptomyces antimicrobicus]MCB5178579.1 thioesterase [Streptomyces antimicrobicus]
MKVVCFAHAGAGVSAFHRWPELIGPGVDVVPWLLPGRDRRRREPRVVGRDGLLRELSGIAAVVGDEPYALYGHSLGGLVAYTLARASGDVGLEPPALLGVGALPPPDAVAALVGGAGLDDAALVALLARCGAVPEGVRAGDVWHRSVLPVLRDDLALAAALRGAADGPVDAPLLAVAGREDPLGRPGAVAGWRRWTTGRFVRRTVPGGHFFVRDAALPRMVGRAVRVVARCAR